MNTYVLNWIKSIGVSGFLDILCLAAVLYFLLVWFKRTRAAFVLTGIFIITGAYLLMHQFNLVLTASLFENFFAIILIAMVVIFQEELRNFFERVAIWSLNRHLIRKKVLQLSREEVQILVRTLVDLSKEKIGTLIVIRGKDLIARHLEGGTDLNGELSEGLLKSIFDPHSMGHDGAVIIEGNRITQYSCHLPLTKNLKAIGKGGTRHAAAMGLSEVSDALCLVVSEERGTISIFQNGNLEVVSDPEKLSVTIEKHYHDTYPKRASTMFDLVTRNGKEKFIALFLSFAIWFVFSHGSKIVYRTYKVPINIAEPPTPLEVQEISPNEVGITLYGPRKAFYFANKEKYKTTVNIKKEKGIQILRLSPKNFSLPETINLDKIDPKEVKIKVVQAGEIKLNQKNKR